ncbi:MAG: SDR family oxidoreductase [Saprospirales bacterium]|nr:MAG: SDR family oxidoreductase [Saprospirales bacterium]
MNILITGASRGIGYATCLELSKDPNNRLIALSRDGEKLGKLAAECKAEHRNEIDWLSFDLQKPDWDALLGKLKKLGSLDLLINNAGALINKPFEHTEPKDWRWMMEVNVIGAAEMVRHCLPALQKSDKAHIVNIGSMGGFQGSAKFPGLAAYSASKAAIACWTECIANELAETKISVNCLCLGAVKTEMLAEAFPGFKPPMSAEEMAGFVADFGKNGHQFFGGQIIPVASSNPG